MLLHTHALTRRSFYTQTILHTDAFYTQTLLHANPFTHTKALTSVFNTRPPFRAKGLRANLRNRNFTTRLDIKTYESEQSAANALLSYKKYHLPQFWTIDVKSQFYDRTSFRAKGLSRHTQNRNFTSQFLAIEPPFVRKGCVSCRLVGTASCLKREIEKAREASGQESKRAREQEGKRARGQERMWRCEDVKMWRCEDVKWRWEDVKMWRCEDEKMWRWEDVKMRRCEDEKMWRWEGVKMIRCEDEKMWRWEDVKMRICEDEKMWRCENEMMWRWEDVKWRCENVWQTAAIRRTLRSDALGKKPYWNVWLYLVRGPASGEAML